MHTQLIYRSAKPLSTSGDGCKGVTGKSRIVARKKRLVNGIILAEVVNARE